MSVVSEGDCSLLSAIGLPQATRWLHIASVAEASDVLAEASRAGAAVLWLHGGADIVAPLEQGRTDPQARWLAVVRPLRHFAKTDDPGMVVDVGGGRLWNELDATLRRHGAQLGRWQERLGAQPVGAILGRAATLLDRAAREGWMVQSATCVIDGGVARLDSPTDWDLQRADAILEARLVVQPVRHAAGRQWWRFPDSTSAVLAMRALGPELVDGLTVDLAPVAGLRRGAVWTRAADDGSTWRTALAASLPGAAGFLDRRLRLAERHGWWLRLTCDGEPGVVEVRLARCGEEMRNAGGHLDRDADARGVADWWPDAQPQVTQVALARGASARWSELQLGWECLERTLAAPGAARAWLQVGDGDGVGARLQQWCVEEAPVAIERAESCGERMGRAVGPSLRTAMLRRRRSTGSGRDDAPSSVDAQSRLREAIDALPRTMLVDETSASLWVTAAVAWRDCVAEAAALGRTLPASDSVPDGCTIGALIRHEPAAMAWLRARGTPGARRWIERAVQACGVIAEDGSLVLPRRAAPAAISAALSASLPSDAPRRADFAQHRRALAQRRTAARPEAWAVALRLEMPTPTRRLWWSGTLSHVWGVFPLLSKLAIGMERLAVLVMDGSARVCIEVAGQRVRSRRIVDLLSELLPGLHDDAEEWPTARLLSCHALRLRHGAAVPPGTCALTIEDEFSAMALLQPESSTRSPGTSAGDATTGSDAGAATWS